MNNPDIEWYRFKRKSSSSTSKRQVYSIERQEEDMSQYFSADDYPTKDENVFYEEVSGYDRNVERIELDKMLNQIEQSDKPCGILSWKISRLGRRIAIADKLTNLIEKGNLVDIRTIDYTFENTPEGIARLQKMLVEAEEYSRSLSCDVKSGQWIQFSKYNKRIGSLPPGYEWRLVANHHSEITDDKERLFKIQLTYRKMIDENFTPQQGLHYLNKDLKYRGKARLYRGKLMERPMNESSWYRCIRNPFYYGLVINTLDGKKYQRVGSHKPIITKEEFEKLQVIGKNSGCIKREFPFKDYLITKDGSKVTAKGSWGVRCNNCGKKMFKGSIDDLICVDCDLKYDPKYHRKANWQVSYYPTQKNSGIPSMSGKVLFQKISSMLSEVEMKLEFINWCFDSLRYLYEFNNELTKVNTQIEEGRVVKIECEINRLKDSYANAIANNSSEIIISSIEEGLLKKEKEMSETKILIKTIKSKLENKEVPSKSSFNFQKYCQHFLNHGTLKQKNMVVSCIARELLFEKDGISAKTPSEIAFAFDVLR